MQNGIITNCYRCRYWSALCAQSIGGGQMEALCLSAGLYSGKYTVLSTTCDSWAENHYGSVDEPAKDNFSAYKCDDYEVEIARLRHALTVIAEASEENWQDWVSDGYETTEPIEFASGTGKRARLALTADNTESAP